MSSSPSGRFAAAGTVTSSLGGLRDRIAFIRGHYRLRDIPVLAKYAALRGLTSLVGAGRKCPVCGWRGREFRPFIVDGTSIRTRVRCPTCGSLERQRAIALHLPTLVPRLFPNRRPDTIHVSPEAAIEPLVRSLVARYVKSNYENPAPDEIQLDLLDLDYPSEACDLFLAIGVLGCVPDDRRAVANMSRVLRPGGAIVTCDYAVQGKETREWGRQGYGGGFRTFGTEKLRERFAPLELECFPVHSGLTAEEARMYGLHPSEYIFVFHKPDGPPRPGHE